MKTQGFCMYCGNWEKEIEDFVCKKCSGNWGIYELEKKRIQNRNLSSNEYEKAILKLCKDLKI